MRDLNLKVDPLGAVTSGFNAVSTIASGVFGHIQGQTQAEMLRAKLRADQLREREARALLERQQYFATQQAAFESQRERRNQQILALLTVGIVGVTVAGALTYAALKRRR